MPLELPDGWREQLPEDIRENGALDDIKDIDQMATMIVNGRKLQTKQITIPGEDAAPEKRKAFLDDLQEKVPDLVFVGEGADMGHIHDRMGRPKDVVGYELADIPESLKGNFDNLTTKAHELGITKVQMKGISETILGDFETNTNLQTANLQKAKDGVKTEFGEATAEKLKSTALFAKNLGFDTPLVDAIGEGAIGVENMKAFDKLMDGYKSPGPRIGDDLGGNETSHLTPDQAELKISEIQNNKEHPYWDGSSPAHKAAVQQMVELTRAADAGKPQTENDKFRDALMGRG